MFQCPRGQYVDCDANGMTVDKLDIFSFNALAGSTSIATRYYCLGGAPFTWFQCPRGQYVDCDFLHDLSLNLEIPDVSMPSRAVRRLRHMFERLSSEDIADVSMPSRAVRRLRRVRVRALVPRHAEDGFNALAGSTSIATGSTGLEVGFHPCVSMPSRAVRRLRRRRPIRQARAPSRWFQCPRGQYVDCDVDGGTPAAHEDCQVSMPSRAVRRLRLGAGDYHLVLDPDTGELVSMPSRAVRRLRPSGTVDALVIGAFQCPRGQYVDCDKAMEGMGHKLVSCFNALAGSTSIATHSMRIQRATYMPSGGFNALAGSTSIATGRRSLLLPLQAWVSMPSRAVRRLRHRKAPC